MARPDRFERQRLLPEIGERGQALLEAARLRLGAGLTLEVRASARLYAEGLGIRSIREEEDEVRACPFPHHDLFRHAPARALGQGAHIALLGALQALGLSPSDDR